MLLLTKEQRKERRSKTCRHFNGIMNDCCDLGIAYKSVRDETQSPYTFPCLGLGKDESCSTSCEKRDFFTWEEITKQDEETGRAVAEYLENLKRNICPNHKVKITPMQVGQCVYAKECGCRLYQGNLAAMKS